MAKPFKFICDPGHGWLEVDWTDLKAIGLNRSDFSSYSYRKRNKFYLEEDCDAPKFIKTWEAKFGHELITDSIYQETTFIRDLHSIRYGA